MKNHSITKADLLNDIKLKKKIDSLIPQVYASLVITLADHYGWNFEDIKTLIEFNQDVWNSCNKQGIGMLNKCAEEYGINLIEIVGGDDSGECKTFL